MTEFIKLPTPDKTIQIGFTDQKVSGRAGLLTFASFLHWHRFGGLLAGVLPRFKQRRRGYTRLGNKPCLHPLLAVLAEAKLVAGFWLRPGNSSCANNVVAFTLDLMSYTTRGLLYYLRFGEQLEIPSEQRGEGRRVLVMGQGDGLEDGGFHGCEVLMVLCVQTLLLHPAPILRTSLFS